MDASRVYVRARALACFHNLISIQTFWRALTASVDSCAEIKGAPFSGVTKSSRVWRKVPESDARSVGQSVLGVCSTFQQAERVSEKTCTVTVGTLRTRHDL